MFAYMIVYVFFDCCYVCLYVFWLPELWGRGREREQTYILQYATWKNSIIKQTTEIQTASVYFSQMP